jgi:hypothetical protein
MPIITPPLLLRTDTAWADKGFKIFVDFDSVGVPTNSFSGLSSKDPRMTQIGLSQFPHEALTKLAAT